MEGSGSVTVSGPESGRAHHPVAAATGGNLGASAPPGRTAVGRVWRWRWGRLEEGPVAGRPGGPAGSQSWGGGGLGRLRWCMSALQRRLRQRHCSNH